MKDLEGKTYDDLSRTLKRVIDQTQVIAYIINPGTPDNVKYNIFKRINTGGLFLEPQEIRHALNQGAPARFVARLAGLEEFKKATERKINPKRMLDREFVTRFISFYMNSPQKYIPDLDSFLNNSMARIAALSDNDKYEIEEKFKNAMSTAFEIFGNWAFRKADLYPDRRKPISKALFETWAVSLAKMTGREHGVLIKNKQKVIRKFVEACRDDEVFLSAISSSTGEKNKVKYRFRKIRNLLLEIVDDSTH